MGFLEFSRVSALGVKDLEFGHLIRSCVAGDSVEVSVIAAWQKVHALEDIHDVLQLQALLGDAGLFFMRAHSAAPKSSAGPSWWYCDCFQNLPPPKILKHHLKQS